LTPIWFRELQIIGAYGRGRENFQGRQIGTYQLTHQLMAGGKMDLSEMLTHKFRIEQYRRAFALSLNKSAGRAIKVAFDSR
jgi:threonine dehydrogenase-like Zn-dependent dehydrogenase